MQTKRESPSTGDRIAVAALVAGAIAPLTYIAIRVLERVRVGAWDVTLVIYERTTGFYWRLLVAVWFASLIGAVVHALLDARPAAIRRWSPPLGIAFLAVLVAIATLAYVFP